MRSEAKNAALKERGPQAVDASNGNSKTGSCKPE